MNLPSLHIIVPRCFLPLFRQSSRRMRSNRGSSELVNDQIVQHNSTNAAATVTIMFHKYRRWPEETETESRADVSVSHLSPHL